MTALCLLDEAQIWTRHHVDGFRSYFDLHLEWTSTVLGLHRPHILRLMNPDFVDLQIDWPC